MQVVKRYVEAELLAKKGGSITRHLQYAGDHVRSKNRNAIKSFLCCTHFPSKKEILHTTNFDKLINLVISCGRKDLEEFVRRDGKECNLHLIRCYRQFRGGNQSQMSCK